MMESLWAPWRSEYIARPQPSADGPPCFICRALAEPVAADRDNLLVCRYPSALVLLNRFPYNNGHLLVAPTVHEGRLEALEGDALHGPVAAVQLCIQALNQVLRPHGFNVGLNLGAAAGAGLPGHLHWHIVPRWDGDTNFMPVVAGSKVIVESLLAFYDRLVAVLPGPD